MSKAPTCTADYHQRGTAPPIHIVRWHLHRGTHRYYIVGPGTTAMHPCSDPDYANREPTIQPREAAIARAAVQILTQRHPNDKEAGPKEIQLALQLGELRVPRDLATTPDLTDLLQEPEPALP